MPAQTTKKQPSAKKQTSRPSKKAWYRSIQTQAVRPLSYVAHRTHDFLLRRPHRSFRRTRRRDYVRSLKLPGYWAFTNYVRRTLAQHKWTFSLLIVIYGTLTVLLVGVAAQDAYSQLGELLRSTSGDVFKGNMGAISKAGLLLFTGVTGRFNTSITSEQQMYAVILALFTWLTTVWLLRAVLAGGRPRLRDGLYNAGAPVLPTFLVLLLFVVQLVPVALAALGFVALTPFGILDGGIESMLFWTVAGLLVMLSLYWITSTLIALVVVTLPGMYPMQAIRTAGDLVIGRRLRVLLRLLWLLGTVVVSWLVVMIPIILFDVWLKGILPAVEWVPNVPVALLVMGLLTVIWMASYVYLLYRRIVDDDAAPA